MGLQDAIRADADSWPGLQEELSRTVCGSAQGLRHKLVGYKGAKFSPEELAMLMLATGSRHTVTALARELGGVFLQLPPLTSGVDLSTLEAECQAVTMRLADMFAEIHQAVANDGQIDGDERKRIEASSHALREQVLRYLTLSFRLYAPLESQ
ncbi:hypothetical protein GCM10027202_12360 [Microvirgula curvata]